MLCAAGLAVSSPTRVSSPSAAPVGALLRAALDATIVSASGKIQPKRSVNISADTMGRVTSLAVNEGDRVQAGQALARIGNSGNSLGPHLHFQVSDAIEPRPERNVELPEEATLP